jgi:hypothetical protein
MLDTVAVMYCFIEYARYCSGSRSVSPEPAEQRIRHLQSGQQLNIVLRVLHCLLAQDNLIWLSGKQIFIPTCPTDYHIFHSVVDIYHIRPVKIKSLSDNQL